MNKKVFAIRMTLFSLFACVLPFTFIAWRYDLFRKVDKIAMSGWGLISLVIVFLFGLYVVRSIKKCLENEYKWSMSMQIFNGFVKVVLPLLALYFIIVAIEAKIDFFKQSLIVLIVCEAIAVPVNPLPQLETHTKMLGIEKTGTLLKRGSEK